MITIARFPDAFAAHLAKTMLENEGVPAVVLDENLGRLEWFLPNRYGGVRLQVAEEDEARARDLLATDFSDSLESSS